MPLLPKKSTDRQYMLLAFKIMADFGATIAVPVVVFVLVGQWLDGRHENAPWFTVLGFAIAALLSARMIWKKAKEYAAQYEKIGKQGKNKNL